MYLYPKVRTNILVLVSYLLAWASIGAGASAFVAYGIVDISISTLVVGGVFGLVFAVVLDLLGITNYMLGESSNPSGLIENACQRLSTSSPKTDQILPSPSEIEPARKTEREASSYQAFYEALPRFRDQVIREIKRYYSKERFNCLEGPVVDIFPPKEIYQRYDLFCREVVPWLVERGWQWDKEDRITYFKLSLRAQPGR